MDGDWPDGPSQKVCAQSSLVKHWLNGSGASLLTVYIRIHGDHYLADWEKHPALRELLVQSHRWKVAYLTIPSLSAWSWIPSIGGNLSSLKKLVLLTRLDPEGRLSVPININSIGPIPNLEVLTIDDNAFFNARDCHKNLTSLHLRTGNFHCLLDVLDHIPRLEKCFVYFTDTPMLDYPDNRSMVHHKSLRVLHLVPTTRPLVQKMNRQLDKLILPSLEHLELHSSELFYTSAWAEHPLGDFLTRSKCALQHLTFTCPEFFHRDMVSFISSIPMSITHLRLDLKSDLFLDTLFTHTLLNRFQEFELRFEGSKLPSFFAALIVSSTPDILVGLTKLSFGLKGTQELHITAIQLDNLDRWSRGGVRIQVFLVLDPKDPWAAPAGDAVCFDSALGGPVFGRFKIK